MSAFWKSFNLGYVSNIREINTYVYISLHYSEASASTTPSEDRCLFDISLGSQSRHPLVYNFKTSLLPLPLSLVNRMSRSRSWLRKPEFGQTPLCSRTVLRASTRVLFSQIIKKASTSVAERLIPMAQWTNTLPAD